MHGRGCYVCVFLCRFSAHTKQIYVIIIIIIIKVSCMQDVVLYAQIVELDTALLCSQTSSVDFSRTCQVLIQIL